MKTYHHTNPRAAASIFTALGDDTRRTIFELLHAGPRPVGELAAELPISRPAVSQHLKVLKDAGLVQDEPRGSRRLYRVDPDALRAMRDYFDGLWSTALDRFKAAAEAEEGGRR